MVEKRLMPKARMVVGPSEASAHQKIIVKRPLHIMLIVCSGQPAGRSDA